jgi:CubicO group peptidase (beta-lactamase class C family)
VAVTATRKTTTEPTADPARPTRVTQQHPDLVDYIGRVYCVAAVDGSDLFVPARYGLRAEMLSTGCWRGYVASYAVVDDNLRLVEVEVSRQSDPPYLFGTPPRIAPRHAYYPGTLFYTGMSAPLEFTGRMLIGHEWVDIGRQSIGFTPAWGFEIVHELRFDDDRLVEATDISDEMADIRDRVGDIRGLLDSRPTSLPWSLSYAWSRPEL